MIIVGPPETWPDWLKDIVERIKKGITDLYKRRREERPEIIKTLEAINAGLNPVAAATAFSLFFIEEAMQAVMFAIIGAEQAKRYALIPRLVERGYRLYGKGKKILEDLGWTNPMFAEVYGEFFEAMKEFYDSSLEVAYTGKPTWGEKTLWDMRSPEGEE